VRVIFSLNLCVLLVAFWGCSLSSQLNATASTSFIMSKEKFEQITFSLSRFKPVKIFFPLVEMPQLYCFSK